MTKQNYKLKKMNIVEIPSPNFEQGRRNYKPIAIVIHIMEGTLAGTDSWFKSTISKVSAHYGIGQQGQVHHYVQEKDTAWHAGRVNAPIWALIKQTSPGSYINPNFYTIGIEHEGDDNTDWPQAMYNTSAALIKTISNTWGIPLDRQHVIGHHEIYSLKTCPGNKVDIDKLIQLAKSL
jgi:N-acetyl-anhydromuramyl-L-alanine amidase AmpD